MSEIKLLGINIDHVATIRNARGGDHPDPVKAAHLAKNSGADIITFHLREDRRHIKDEDVFKLAKEINVPLNMEMAATNEMLAIAKKIKPKYVCIVPEKRKEITTEDGLDIDNISYMTDYVRSLQESNIKVSLFIDPEIKAIENAAKTNADIVEIHTGHYANAVSKEAKEIELSKIKNAVEIAKNHNFEIHAGHGINFDNIIDLTKINDITTYHIGHFVIGESIFIGLENAIYKLRSAINN